MANSTLCANKLNITNISNVNYYGDCNNYFCCVSFPNSCFNGCYVCFYNTNKITTLKKVYINNNVVNVNGSNLNTANVAISPVYLPSGGYCFKFFYSI